ncbi:MAG TPA: SH3 domain-containing protein, partial [Saprospiraceae bacterium]|nr:SH3 domain-containing protein [Saprospiraceae bacterium]
MTLKTTLSLLGLLLSLQTLSGQSLFYFNAGDTTFVFGDKINVRNQPGTDAPVAFQLAAGDMVILLEEREERSTLNKLDQPWYKIKTPSGQTGFIWGGLLSLWGAQQDGEVKFVAGVVQSDGAQPEQDGVPTLSVEVRAVRNGAVISKVSTKIQNQGTVRNRSIEFGARGLKGFRDLLCFDIGVDACGYPNDEWYILWDGIKLVPLPIITSIADGGVFYHSEDYLFPEGSPWDENGRSGHYGDPSLIFLSISHGETEELDEN